MKAKVLDLNCGRSCHLGNLRGSRFLMMKGYAQMRRVKELTKKDWCCSVCFGALTNKRVGERLKIEVAGPQQRH